MPHELVHGRAELRGRARGGRGGRRRRSSGRRGAAQVGRRLVVVASPPHGRQVVGREQHLEELVERLGLDEGVEAGRVETQRAEHGGQRAEHLARRRHVLLEQRVEDDVGEAVLLQLRQLRRLLEDEVLHDVRGEQKQRRSVVVGVRDDVLE